MFLLTPLPHPCVYLLSTAYIVTGINVCRPIIHHKRKHDRSHCAAVIPLWDNRKCPADRFMILGFDTHTHVYVCESTINKPHSASLFFLLGDVCVDIRSSFCPSLGQVYIRSLYIQINGNHLLFCSTIEPLQIQIYTVILNPSICLQRGTTTSNFIFFLKRDICCSPFCEISNTHTHTKRGFHSNQRIILCVSVPITAADAILDWPPFDKSFLMCKRLFEKHQPIS